MIQQQQANNNIINNKRLPIAMVGRGHGQLGSENVKVVVLRKVKIPQQVLEVISDKINNNNNNNYDNNSESDKKKVVMKIITIIKIYNDNNE